MDIKDIKRAMDNMPMGDGSAFAEISVGPAKHEQFLDEHYGKVALVVLLCVLGAAGWIIYNGMQDSMERKAGAALVAAMPESPATGEISLNEQGLQQVVADFDDSRAAVTATYLQAVALWNAGKEDEGVARMKAFIDSAPTEEWKAQASVTLACRLMNRGKADEADGLFRSVVDAGDPTFPVLPLCAWGTLPGRRRTMPPREPFTVNWRKSSRPARLSSSAEATCCARACLIFRAPSASNPLRSRNNPGGLFRSFPEDERFLHPHVCSFAAHADFRVQARRNRAFQRIRWA